MKINVVKFEMGNGATILANNCDEKRKSQLLTNMKAIGKPHLQKEIDVDERVNKVVLEATIIHKKENLKEVFSLVIQSPESLDANNKMKKKANGAVRESSQVMIYKKGWYHLMYVDYMKAENGEIIPVISRPSPNRLLNSDKDYEIEKDISYAIWDFLKTI